MNVERIAFEVVNSAFKVHRSLGPGLLESAYQACLAHELRKCRIDVKCEVPLPVEYEGSRIDIGYRIDMLVGGAVLVEVKAVERVIPIHEAQVLTYLKLTGLTLGFLINFNVRMLRDGLKRLVLNHPEQDTGKKTTSPRIDRCRET
jgi:GxxExxY protein